MSGSIGLEQESLERKSAMQEQRLAPLSKGEWPGSTSNWHIQAHKRDVVGPGGPAHWPRRPADIGGFCQSIGDKSTLGRKHMFDPPTSMVNLLATNSAPSKAQLKRCGMVAGPSVKPRAEVAIEQQTVGAVHWTWRQTNWNKAHPAGTRSDLTCACRRAHLLLLSLSPTLVRSLARARVLYLSPNNRASIHQSGLPPSHRPSSILSLLTRHPRVCNRKRGAGSDRFVPDPFPCSKFMRTAWGGQES